MAKRTTGPDTAANDVLLRRSTYMAEHYVVRLKFLKSTHNLTDEVARNLTILIEKIGKLKTMAIPTLDESPPDIDLKVQLDGLGNGRVKRLKTLGRTVCENRR
eukprot:Opistho-2@8002